MGLVMCQVVVPTRIDKHTHSHTYVKGEDLKHHQGPTLPGFLRTLNNEPDLFVHSLQEH